MNTKNLVLMLQFHELSSLSKLNTERRMGGCIQDMIVLGKTFTGRGRNLKKVQEVTTKYQNSSNRRKERPYLFIYWLSSWMLYLRIKSLLPYACPQIWPLQLHSHLQLWYDWVFKHIQLWFQLNTFSNFPSCMWHVIFPFSVILLSVVSVTLLKLSGEIF